MDKNVLISIVAVIAVIATFGAMVCGKKSEQFTLPSPRPPEWFLPEPYQVDKWLTKYYPDQLSVNQCTPYNRGPVGALNFNSSSYRFMRF